jgi:hypothetical protein
MLMSDPKDQDYEFVEIKVSKKIDIHLSLDDLINAVEQQASALTSTAQQIPPQVVDRLNQLTQLAHQLKSDMSSLGQPNPPAGPV